ncbi:MAG: hypothetical protein QOD98_939 [Nocardioidaceae bacterium]|nr:hypothetical protein [Nocardioidaceae bacterium]
MSAPTDAPAQRAAAEEWFLDHGLPWFVDDVRNEVTRRLHRGRVTAVLVTGVVLGLLTGLIVGSATSDASIGVASGASFFGAPLLAYALWALHAKLIVGWALRRAFRSLGLLLPLATRALPMLLLFVTFLFINADLWQVAAQLQGGILWSAILFFILAALGFLVPRLAQEMDQVDTLDGEALCAATEGTPLEESARRMCDRDVDLSEGAEVKGLQKVNLVTVLVVAQAVQVVLLSIAVFVFFIVFGLVAIQADVIEGWLGHPPTYPPGPEVVSLELIRVSTFLAGFSGFYFTIIAITDELYRKEFFTVILAELQRAVAARAVYRRLAGTGITGGGTPAPPAPAG